MANPSKAKGSRYEVELENYFNAAGLPAHRKVQSGANDKGDLALSRFTVEAKNCRTLELAAWMDEAVREAFNAGTEFHLLAIRRRMKSVGQSYAVMTLNQFTTLALAFIELTREVELHRRSA